MDTGHHLNFSSEADLVIADDVEWGHARDGGGSLEPSDFGPQIVRLAEHWCRLRDITLAELARRNVRLRESSFTKWRGSPKQKPDIPTLASLHELAIAMDLTLGDLLYQSGIIDPQKFRPPTPTVEEVVLVDPTLSDAGREAMIALLGVPRLRRRDHI